MSKTTQPQVEFDAASLGIASASPCPRLTNAVLAREHMLIAGAKVEESVEVLWLQGKTWFIDVRTGFNDGTRQGWAFAGQIEWANPKVTFHHLVDTAGDTGVDCGSFVFTDFGCFEAGEVTRDGVTLPFEEKWCRVTSSTCTQTFVFHTDNQLAAVKIVQDRRTAYVCQFGAAVYIEKDGLLEVERAFTSAAANGHSTQYVLDYFASANWQLIETT
tara:strand:- start:6503 stop:7150 length:648 start_codon:yes stop_codon:yes gene_type:complete